MGMLVPEPHVHAPGVAAAAAAAAGAHALEDSLHQAKTCHELSRGVLQPFQLLLEALLPQAPPAQARGVGAQQTAHPGVGQQPVLTGHQPGQSDVMLQGVQWQVWGLHGQEVLGMAAPPDGLAALLPLLPLLQQLLQGPPVQQLLGWGSWLLPGLLPLHWHCQ